MKIYTCRESNDFCAVDHDTKMVFVVSLNNPRWLPVFDRKDALIASVLSGKPRFRDSTARWTEIEVGDLSEVLQAAFARDVLGDSK